MPITFLQFLFVVLFCLDSMATDDPGPLYCTNKSNSSNLQKSIQENSEPATSLISNEEVYVQKLMNKLTGSGLPFNSPKLKRMAKMVEQGKYFEVALLGTEEKGFLSVRVKNFSSPFTNKDYSYLEPFNDLQALIIGLTRDGADARELLTGDLRYQAHPRHYLPAVSRSENLHYSQFEALQLDLQNDLIKITPQWAHNETGTGAFTTRSWAKVNYDGGTNRRALRNAFDLFMCAPIENWKTRGVPDFYVRRDISRSPGGKPSDYQNVCKTCHSIMDGMSGAFSKMDFIQESLFFSPSEVRPKYNQNENIYPEGYVTIDDSFENLMTYNPGLNFGFRTKLKGQGLADFANMLAQSRGFSRCLVQKVFYETCGLSLSQQNSELLESMTDDFENEGRNLRVLFARSAAHELCVQHPRLLFIGQK